VSDHALVVQGLRGRSFANRLVRADDAQVNCSIDQIFGKTFPHE
jgi:hypothetical protein